MKGHAHPAVQPDWQQFLNFEKLLLQQPDTASQCQIIINQIKQRINCQQVKVWLSPDFYPLPGKNPPIQLINQSCTDLVQQVLNTQQIYVQEKSGELIQLSKEHISEAIGAALPLKSSENFLGIIEVYQSDPPYFYPPAIEYLTRLSANAVSAMEISRQAAVKNWRYEQLALVRSVGQQVANVTDLQELCKRVTQLICKAFNYYHVSIYTQEIGSETLCRQASASTSSSHSRIVHTAIKIGEGIVGQVAADGIELIASDISKEPHYRFSDSLPNTQSEAAFPLLVENQILGVLDVQSDQINAFHEIDRLVLRSLADNIALAIEGVYLFSELEENLEKISAVSEVGRSLTSILELDQLPDEAMQLIRERFGYPYVHLFTVHTGRQLVIYMTGSGPRSKEMREREICYDLYASSGMIPWVARNGKTILANDVTKNAHYRPTELLPAKTRSELTIPLIYAGEILGVLDIQSDRINAFDENDLPLIEAVAGSLATALRNATLYQSEKWRRQVSDSFRDVAGLLSENIAIDHLLDTILSELEKNLPCDVSAIWLAPSEQKEYNDGKLTLAAAHGIDPNLLQSDKLPNSASTWLKGALNKASPTIRKPDDPYEPLGKALSYPESYSAIAAPLHIGEQPLGIITLFHPTHGRYGSEAAAMTSTFASYAAIAIQNARFYANSQQQAWFSTVMLQVAESCQAAETVDDLLSTTVRITPLLVGVKRCGIFLWEEAAGGFQLKSWYGVDETPTSRLFLESATPAFAQIHETLAPIFITNPKKELNLPELEPSKPINTLVLLPLLARNHLLGALLVEHQSTGQIGAEQSFTENTLAILQGIVRQTALALENLQLLEKQQQESYVTAVMLQVSQVVASQNQLDDILDSIVHLMPILVGIDVCIIYLWDQDTSTFNPAKVFTGNHKKDTQITDVSYKKGDYPLLDAVLQTNQIYHCAASSVDHPPETWNNLSCAKNEALGVNTSSSNEDWVLGFPLNIKNELYGVLVARDSGETPAFRDKRVEIIEGITRQIAMAIQNEKLSQELVERERMEREIQLARQIQRSFLPNQLPSPEGWDIDARWETARRVGGDFYDIIKLDQDRIGLVIADVSDKGMAAALYMTVTSTLIRANIINFISPARVLEQVNNLLIPYSQNGMFVTAVIGILNKKTGVLTVANAGHNRPLLLKAVDGSIETLPKGKIALGVLEDIQYEDHQISIESGDLLILYTDGITEAFSPAGEIFGEFRLKEILTKNKGRPIQFFFSTLNTALKRFQENLPPSDDITILAIRRTK